MLPFATVALRLFVALALGALIGAERERRDRSSASHSAGVRTLALVSLGSALVMIVSAYGFLQFHGIAGVQVQPAQIAAQVITGIGFLGAGVILLRRDTVRGLTTAATVWLVAGIGLPAAWAFSGRRHWRRCWRWCCWRWFALSNDGSSRCAVHICS